MKNLDEVGSMNWAIGYNGMGVCEYYLRTGDQSVLPAIQKGADHLRDHIYNGGWAGRATGSYGYQSGGHVNASGIHCLTFLLLAKTCGVVRDGGPIKRASIGKVIGFSEEGEHFLNSMPKVTSAWKVSGREDQIRLSIRRRKRDNQSARLSQQQLRQDDALLRQCGLQNLCR